MNDAGGGEAAGGKWKNEVASAEGEAEEVAEEDRQEAGEERCEPAEAGEQREGQGMKPNAVVIPTEAADAAAAEAVESACVRLLSSGGCIPPQRADQPRTASMSERERRCEWSREIPSQVERHSLALSCSFTDSHLERSRHVFTAVYETFKAGRMRLLARRRTSRPRLKRLKKDRSCFGRHGSDLRHQEVVWE